MVRTSGKDTGNPLAEAVTRSIREARQSLTEIQQKIDSGTLTTTTTPATLPQGSGNGLLNGGLTGDRFVTQSNVGTGNWSGLGLDPASGFLPLSGFNTAGTAQTDTLSQWMLLQRTGMPQANATPPPTLQLQQTILGLLSLLFFPYMSQNPTVIAPPTAPTTTATTANTAGKQNAITSLQKVLTVSEAEKTAATSDGIPSEETAYAVSQEDVTTLSQSLKTGQFSQGNLASALNDGFATADLEALDEIAVLTGQLVDQGVLSPKLLLNEQSLQGMDEAGLNALSQGLANAGIWKQDKTVNRSLTDWLMGNLGGNTLNNPTPAQRAFAQRLVRDTLNIWQGYYDTPEGQYLQNFANTRLGLKITPAPTDPASVTFAPDNEQPFPLTSAVTSGTV